MLGKTLNFIFLSASLLASPMAASNFSALCSSQNIALNAAFQESVWSQGSYLALSECSYVNNCGAHNPNASATFLCAWNSQGLWVSAKVLDAGPLYADAANPWNGSAVEAFLDLDDKKLSSTAQVFNDPHTYQWIITYDAAHLQQYGNPAGVTILVSSVMVPGNGYNMEIEIPWANLGLSGPPAGGVSGFDLAVDVANAAGNARDHQIAAFNAQNFDFYIYAPDWADMSYGSCAPLSYNNSLYIYDANSVLIESLALPASDHLLSSIALSSSSFNPNTGSLGLSSGDWSYAFGGKDSQGRFLENGSYVLEIDSSGGGGTSAQTRASFAVATQNADNLNASLGPNPVLRGDGSANIRWSANGPVSLSIYSLAGSLVKRVENLGGSEWNWDLKSASSQEVSDGIYLIAIRPNNASMPSFLKLAILR
jgi:hypothetical protein